MIAKAVLISLIIALLCGWILAVPNDLLVYGALILCVSILVLEGLPNYILAKRRKTSFPSLWKPDWRNEVKSLLRFAKFILIIIAIKIIWLSYLELSGSGNTKEDIMARRQYLIEKLAGNKFDLSAMPSFLPREFKQEWAIGSFSMTAGALTHIAFQFPETREEALLAIKNMLSHMLEPQIREYEIFWWKEDALKSLDSDNGHAGYLGHLNFMLSAYKILGGTAEFDELHASITASLSRRILKSPHHFIETFPKQIFIPDNAAAVASIALYNRLNANVYKEAVDAWLKYAREKLADSDTGLLKPWIATSGLGFGPARGSYSAWNIYYLNFIDPLFAEQQYQQLEKYFKSDLILGAKAIREYRHGTKGQGDIDSGPVLFGLSTSGTGFAVSGATLFGTEAVREGLLKTAELAGFSWDWKGTKRYLLAPLVGDAIMLAMKTATDWDLRFAVPEIK